MALSMENKKMKTIARISRLVALASFAFAVVFSPVAVTAYGAPAAPVETPVTPAADAKSGELSNAEFLASIGVQS